jgi:hypothetical protein
VHKRLPKSIATIKGHLNQQRENIRSTQQPTTPTTGDDTNPTLDSPNDQTNHVFAFAIDVTGQIATNPTGRFPNTSSCGNKYILVLYDDNSNSILAKPMKNGTDAKHLRAYNKLHQYLVT